MMPRLSDLWPPCTGNAEAEEDEVAGRTMQSWDCDRDLVLGLGFKQRGSVELIMAIWAGKLRESFKSCNFLSTITEVELDFSPARPGDSSPFAGPLGMLWLPCLAKV